MTNHDYINILSMNISQLILKYNKRTIFTTYDVNLVNDKLNVIGG